VADPAYAISEQARELLVAAHDHNGRIFKFEFEEGGPLIRAGTFERTGADWSRALDELLDKGLAIYHSGSPTESGETFELTPDAYKTEGRPRHAAP
jgi:hypothetical protein